MPASPTPPPVPPKVRLWIDYGPLGVFFAVNWAFGIYPATAALIAAVLAAIGASWALERRVAPMTIFTGAAVAVFGGLTIWLGDERFIKLKLTVINGLLAAVLLGGTALGRSPLRALLGDQLSLPDAAWRTLTVRYALFFLALAGLNEIVWRNVSTDTWVSFKVFGVLGLTLVFTLLQTPFLNRHARNGRASGSSEPS